MKYLVKGGQGRSPESITFDAIVVFVCIIVGLALALYAVKAFENKIDNVGIERIEK